MIKTWVVGDAHINHKNVEIYCQRPPNWFELYLKHWNDRVKQEDIVYDLGDVILYHPEDLKEILANLPGTKYLIKGNHDRKSDSWYREAGYAGVFKMVYQNGVLFSHIPQLIPGFAQWNIHGHLHNSVHEEERDSEAISRVTERHILYSPELENYYPKEVSELVGRAESKLRMR